MKFARGTKEYMIVDITETLGDILSLDGSVVTYSIFTSDNVAVQSYQDLTTVIVTGFQIRCLVEPASDWEPGDYLLYVKISGLGSEEEPRLGPIPFTVTE